MIVVIPMPWRSGVWSTTSSARNTKVIAATASEAAHSVSASAPVWINSHG
jgi:hypothetical protein